jgi:hypothetical protein
VNSIPAVVTKPVNVPPTAALKKLRLEEPLSKILISSLAPVEQNGSINISEVSPFAAFLEL